MYNALIIDDEKHVRQTIAALGKWAENHMNPPAQATDGESALRLMEECPIDLVLVDIKMPVMDGMKFIEIAAKRFPKTKYMIVSGFSDFEYAKKAIQFQVLDYLLKPISEAELNQCLSKAAKELDDEYEMMNESPHLSLIDQMCANTPHGDSCIIATIRIADSSQYTWNETMMQALQNCLDQYVFPGMTYMCAVEQPYIMLLGINFSNFNLHIPALQKITTCLAQASAALYRQTHLVTLTGIGPPVPSSVSELKRSYQMATHLMNKLNLCRPDSIVVNEASDSSENKIHSIASRKDIIKRAMEKGDCSYFQNLLELYFESLKGRSLLTAETLSHNSVELLILMQEFAQEKCTEKYQQILPALDKLEQLNTLHYAEGIIEFFCRLLYELCQLTDSDHQLTIKFILQEIKTYVEDQYACDITLTFFSDKYHMTKEYLSKQFKEQYGYGIYEYVLTYRMQKASEYLLSSSMKVQEISNRVGYPDTNYFSKAFKTFFGLSPKEYRQKNLHL